MSITLNDHERRFADSAKGRASIAKARQRHEVQEAYKGSAALPWTDAMEAHAVRALATDEARSELKSAVVDSAAPAAIAAAREQATKARQMHRFQVGNAYRAQR
jgi:predicted ATPase